MSYLKCISIAVISLILISCQTTPNTNGSSNPLISNKQQMTLSGKRTGEGYFSQDGSSWVFQSEREPENPFYQIYFQNLTTGKTTRITPGHGDSTCAWIHPSQNKIMFSSTHTDPKSRQKMKDELAFRASGKKRRYSWNYDESFEIYTARKDGKRIRRITYSKGYDAEGSYSPNGKYIAFASNRAGYKEKLDPKTAERFKQDKSYLMDIYIMDASGKNVKRLTTAKGYDGGPFFSPDGKRIVWRRFAPNGHTAEIYSMNIDGSDKKQITKLKVMSWAPFYHPSGDYIIFTNNKHGYGNFELYIVDTAGKQKPIRVTNMEGFDGLPVFMPNGKTLTWTRKENGSSQIYRADWNDELARKLLKLPKALPTGAAYKPEITVPDLKRSIEYLASEKLQGRLPGTAEEIEYTNRLAKILKSFGLKPGYKGSFIQSFQFKSGAELGTKNSLVMNGKKLGSTDWLPLSFSKPITAQKIKPVFVGYGISAPAKDKLEGYDSYKGLNVKNKWVFLLRNTPQLKDKKMRQHLRTYATLRSKITAARNKGAIGVIVAAGPLGKVKSEVIPFQKNSGDTATDLPAISVSNNLAEAFFAGNSSGKKLKSIQSELNKGKTPKVTLAQSIDTLTVDILQKEKTGRNVIATLAVPGARSSILIGAHADHLGKGHSSSSLMTADAKSDIHFGADDNASGVAAVLELAHAFANNKSTLKKNITFALWSAEEFGILGSQAYMEALKKQKRLKRVSESYNFDMIGRLKDNLLLQGTGSAKEWSQIIETANFATPAKQRVSLKLLEDPYVPSDGMNTYLNKIPTLSFFTGAHEDYHKPSDTAEKINYKGLQKITLFAETLIRNTSKSTTRLTYLKADPHKGKKMRGGFRTFVGTIPDYSASGIKGVKISGATAKSPAEEAGLKKGDILIEFAGQKLKNIYDYVYALQVAEPFEKTTITVLRSGKELKLSITPKSKD